MRDWGFKEIFGWIVIIFFFAWLLTECSNGGDSKTNGLNTTTKMTTFLAQDISTYDEGQDALNTGDMYIFNQFMNTSGAIKLDEGTSLYIQDISPLHGYAEVTVTSGIYKGETGYVPSISINK